MSKKSDYFFMHLKQLYPTMNAPSSIDEEIWEEMLETFEFDDIKDALKSYRKSESGGKLPLPAQFREYLYPYAKVKSENAATLPLSPETYLMDEDIKAGRCKHLFPTYVRAVHYVLNVKLKDDIGEDQFLKLSRGQRYRAAVDNGLFADFDKTLDLVYKERY